MSLKSSGARCCSSYIFLLAQKGTRRTPIRSWRPGCVANQRQWLSTGRPSRLHSTSFESTDSSSGKRSDEDTLYPFRSSPSHFHHENRSPTASTPARRNTRPRDDSRRLSVSKTWVDRGRNRPPIPHPRLRSTTAKGAEGTRPEREPWQVDKAALREKFEGAAWNPRKKLSPDALDGIRTLHAQHPEEFTTSVLADHFKISPEAIRRILKGKWRPTSDEEEARRERWDRRGERIWESLVEQGVHPPRRWREKGIGGGPRRLAQQRPLSEGKRADEIVGKGGNLAVPAHQRASWAKSLATRLA